MATARLGDGTILTFTPDFKPGDPAPTGYLDWHARAEVQQRAGLRQTQCPTCSRWQFPQELSTREVAFDAQTARGRRVRIADFMCLKCAEKQQLPEATDAG